MKKRTESRENLPAKEKLSLSLFKSSLESEELKVELQAIIGLIKRLIKFQVMNWWGPIEQGKFKSVKLTVKGKLF